MVTVTSPFLSPSFPSSIHLPVPVPRRSVPRYCFILIPLVFFFLSAFTLSHPIVHERLPSTIQQHLSATQEWVGGTVKWAKWRLESFPYFPINGAASRVSNLPWTRTEESTLPIERPLSGDPNEKFLSYFPHSGFNNQRVELQNALALANYLNRTLLIPPIWVGKSLPSIGSYRTLKWKWWKAARKSSIFRLQRSQRPDLGDSFISWDFLYDLDFVKDEPRIANRWYGDGTGGEPGMTEKGALFDAGGGDPNKDIFILADEGFPYDLQFSLPRDHSLPLISPIPPGVDSKFRRTVNLRVLAEVPQKLLLLGSIFGSTRIEIGGSRRPPYYNGRLIIDQPKINRISKWIARSIRETGWRMKVGNLKKGYLSILVRVGDGSFKTNVVANMKELWERTVRGILDDANGSESLDESKFQQTMALLRELESERLMKQRRLSHHRKRSLLPRWRGQSLGGTESAWSWYEDPLEDDTPLFEQNSSAVKPVVQDVSQMLLGSVSMEKRLRRRDIPSPPAENISIPTLECHAPLHTNPLLQPFNQPVWMATDARHPAEDENIAKFYATFPCLFTFNDMAQLDHPLGEEVRQIADWKNMEDNGAKIGGFMIPILDSVTAARARLVYPTYGSTFGYYAANQLTQNYRHDPY